MREKLSQLEEIQRLLQTIAFLPREKHESMNKIRTEKDTNW